jgi:lantibiotic biosynthesis protein
LSFSEATQYIDELIESQILISNLEPAITGFEPLEGLINSLRAICSPIANTLQSVSDKMRVMDNEGLGVSRKKYEEIADVLACLPVTPDPAKLFHVDLYKPTLDLALGPIPMSAMNDAAALLLNVASAHPTVDALSQFLADFQEKYGDRSIPLLEALDEESGIGFDRPVFDLDSSPLLSGLQFEPPRTRISYVDDREQRLLRGVIECVQCGSIQWELTAEDVKALSSESPSPAPESLALMATIAATSTKAVDEGKFSVFAKVLVGHSAARVLGRFCHGDEVMRRNVEAHIRKEEALRPDVIHAEIVHLPTGRSGNVLCRPLFREYEIPFLGRSGAPHRQQIPISDLILFTQNDQIKMYSQQHQKEVIPHLSSATDYETSQLTVYRFLCALQSQYKPILFWEWGMLGKSPFLPRVTRGKVVLSLARWYITRAEIEQRSKSSLGNDARFVDALRKERRLPRNVAVADGDAILPLDLEDPLHIRTFVYLSQKGEALRIVEQFPPANNFVVEGSEGRFAHEVIIPFVRRSPKKTYSKAIQLPLVGRFHPGSEWFYAKLYTGPVMADDILCNVVRPLIDRSRDLQAIDRWFFIRYADPSFHLRLRLHERNQRSLTHVVEWLCVPT